MVQKKKYSEKQLVLQLRRLLSEINSISRDKRYSINIVNK